MLTKQICSVNINLQTKQTTYKNLINDEKVDREGQVRGKLKQEDWRYKPMGPIDNLTQYESGNAQQFLTRKTF